MRGCSDFLLFQCLEHGGEGASNGNRNAVPAAELALAPRGRTERKGAGLPGGTIESKGSLERPKRNFSREMRTQGGGKHLEDAPTRFLLQLDGEGGNGGGGRRGVSAPWGLSLLPLSRGGGQ